MSFNYEEFDGNIPAIIVDNGSGVCKAGFAGDDLPRLLLSTILGHDRQATSENELRECFIGENCQAKRDVLHLDYPIDRGIVANWDAMEKIWNYIFFNELNIIPERHPILLTETPLNPKVNKEKMAQVIFETFNFSAIYIAVPAVLSLFANGRTTGVVIDSGDGVMHIVPQYEGHVMSHAVTRLDFAGRDLSNYMMRLLSDRNYSFSTAADRELVR